MGDWSRFIVKLATCSNCNPDAEKYKRKFTSHGHRRTLSNIFGDGEVFLLDKNFLMGDPFTLTYFAKNFFSTSILNKSIISNARLNGTQTGLSLPV